MNKAFEKILERMDSHIEDAKSEGDFLYIKPFEIAKRAVQEVVEEYNGGWIPCSERLPDEGQDVLVWFEYFRYGNYNRLFKTMGISYVYNGKWSGFVNGSSGWSQLRIIAWQPLPEPFKECD